jgi:drug/metabolite transporter (DMT)-like permease
MNERRGDHSAASARRQGGTDIRGDAVKLVGAFSAIYFIWGSTYLVTGFAVRELPPLLLVSMRCLIGTVSLVLWQAVRRIPPPHVGGREIIWMIGTGTVLFIGGHGLLAFGQRSAPSGIAAVMLATIPLWMVAFDAASGGRRASARSVAGIFLGIVGVALLVTVRNHGRSILRFSDAFVLLSAAALWAAASIATARTLSLIPPLPRATGQLVTGCIVAGLLSLSQFSPLGPHWGIKVWAAVLYLGVASSALTFCAYTWLLTRVSAAAAGTYGFVNPLVALIMGVLFAGETLNLPVIAAAALIVGSTVLVLSAASKAPSPQPHEEKCR